MASVYPNNGRDVTASLTRISGLITEPNIDTVTITMGEQTVDATVEDGRFFALVNTATGNNQYTVTAIDQAGNTSDHQGSFYLGSRAAAGGAHSGVIHKNETYVWGRNNLGQLGLGTMTELPDEDDETDIENEHPTTPVRLPSEQTFVSIAFNQNASLAIDSSGNAWAWGDGDDGQLGLGALDSANTAVDETDYSTPQQIPGITNAIAVTRGYDHSMVLTAAGEVYVFGDNSSGQLGDGTSSDNDVPQQVNLENIVQIRAGSRTSYALDADGNIWAWGRNRYGNLGQSHETEDETNYTPVKVPVNARIVSIATGRDHVLALADDGKVFGWGLNASSQVGLHESEQWEREIHTPTQLPWFSDAVAVHANGNQSYAERRDGKIYPWGQNGLGTLGTEQDGNVEAPASPIFGIQNIRSFGEGALHAVAVRQDGNVFAWGWSFEGSLGGGASTIDRWGYRVPLLLALPEATEE